MNREGAVAVRPFGEDGTYEVTAEGLLTLVMPGHGAHRGGVTPDGAFAVVAGGGEEGGEKGKRAAPGGGPGRNGFPPLLVPPFPLSCSRVLLHPPSLAGL